EVCLGFAVDDRGCFADRVLSNCEESRRQTAGSQQPRIYRPLFRHRWRDMAYVRRQNKRQRRLPARSINLFPQTEQVMLWKLVAENAGRGVADRNQMAKGQRIPST